MMDSLPEKHDLAPGVSIQPFDCISRAWDLIKDQYWLFLGITLVGMIIANALAIVLMGPMMSGIYLCYLAKLNGQPVKFEMLFRGFDYFKESFIAGLIIMGFTLAAMLPVYLLMFFGIFGSAALAGTAESEWAGVLTLVFIMLFTCLIFLLAALASVLFIFVFLLIVDRKMSGWEAIKLSARMGWAHIGGLLGLMLLLAALSIVGVFACYIGMFFLMPILFGAVVIAYRKLFPSMEEGYHEK
jgi:hypothetical protein